MSKLFIYAISINKSPGATASPTWICIFEITPSAGDLISVSIFIASRIIKVWSFDTVWPSAIKILNMFPPNGALSWLETEEACGLTCWGWLGDVFDALPDAISKLLFSSIVTENSFSSIFTR